MSGSAPVFTAVPSIKSHYDKTKIFMKNPVDNLLIRSCDRKEMIIWISTLQFCFLLKDVLLNKFIINISIYNCIINIIPIIPNKRKHLQVEVPKLPRSAHSRGEYVNLSFRKFFSKNCMRIRESASKRGPYWVSPSDPSLSSKGCTNN